MRNSALDDRLAVFTGVPSSRSRRLGTGLRIAQAALGVFHADVGSLLARFVTSESPPRRLAKVVNVERADCHGMTVWTLRSNAVTPPSGMRVVCLHGGGYIHQPTTTHWRDYVALARESGAAVMVPMYPVIPHGTASTVVPLVADLISDLVNAHGADTVSVYGDSAGGGLALAATQELVRRETPTHGRMVLLSPWLDVTLSDPDTDDIDDPALNLGILRGSGRQWAGQLDPADPLVSPLFGPVTGLPPTTVYSGSRDMLCLDAINLRDRAIAEGIDIDFVLRAGLIHDWAMSGMPEATEVRPDILRRLLGGERAP